MFHRDNPDNHGRGNWLRFAALPALAAAVAALGMYYAISAFMMSEAEENIQNILLSHRSVHHYIQRVMHPAFYRDRAAGKIPQNYYTPEILSSSYIVRVMHAFHNEERVKAGRPEVYYKLASDNPRNAVNKADSYEMSLIRMFNDNPEQKEFRQIIKVDGKDYLYYAIPFLETNNACLRCHGRRTDAPPGLQRIYTGSGGFNEQTGRIRAIESIRAPLTQEHTSLVIATSSFSAFIFAGLILVLFNRKLRRDVADRTVDLEREIGERVKAEEQLKMREEYYRSFTELTSDYVSKRSRIGSAPFRIKWLGGAIDTITGYTAEEIFEKGCWLPVVHPDDRQLISSRLMNLVPGDRSTLEYRIITKGNDTRWICETNICAAGTEEGELVVFGASSDITERKRAETELRTNEERHRTILKTAMDGMWRMNLQGRLVEVNDAYCRMSGYSEEELLGMGISDLEATLSPSDIVSRMQQIIDVGNARFETSHRRKDGTLFPVEISVQYQSSEENYFFLFLRDITKRRRGEDEIRNLTQRLQLATSAARLGIWDWNIRDNVMVWDDRMMELYGITSETFSSAIDAWENGLHPEDRERAVAECAAALKGEQEFNITFRVLHHDGMVRHIKAKALVLRGADGTPERMIGINEDVTEQVNAEQERAKLESQLLQSQKMESVGLLAGGVAHDFNNKLSVILGHAELALMKTDGNDPLCTDLQEIRQAAESSADLTRQLLAFARKQTVSPRVLDLNQIIEGMLKMLRRLIGEDIDLAWMPGAMLWPINIDPAQIDQVMANLCVNARDAIGGVGKLSIKTEKCSLNAADCLANPESSPGDYVVLVVSDNGQGMSGETRSRIFEPFFTTKELGKGTGLGLATVFGIVKQNNGFINVYSEPGLGTTFKIYLPRHAGDHRESECESVGEIKGGTESILLVEDDPTILAVGREMLESLGYAVEAAGTPEKAIEAAKARSTAFQLLITDVIMPRMNGRDLYEKLRESSPGLKCLFMSGYTSDIISCHGVLDQGVHFLQKPFMLQHLANKIREALSG